MQIPNIPSVSLHAREKAQNRQNTLTKPQGSLGALEDLSIQIAGMTGSLAPRLANRAVFLFAADHGIAREGVSPYPPEVTPQMVFNFLNHGAAINVLTHQANSDVHIIDVGVNYDFGSLPGLIDRKISHGTANMLHGAAMTRGEMEQALQTGFDLAEEFAGKGLQLAATGEMGIGNTTPSAAITALITGLPVADVTGRGTGLDTEGLKRKIALIEEAIRVNQPDPLDPYDILMKVGGLEIAAMAGFTIGCAVHQIPVVLDGLISTAAGALAVMMESDVCQYLIAGHQSEEVGHIALLRWIGITPLLQLGMRVGEGTGAALAFHLIDAANNLLRDMATFADAGVSGADA